MTGKRKFLLALLLLIIAFAIYVYREYNRTNTDIASERPAYSMTATELLQEFTANDSAASRKYAGKIIAVSGMAKSINQDERGLYTVGLGDSSSLSSVRCSVDSIYTSQVAALVPGIRLTIKGNCTGYNNDELLGLDVIMNRCVIENSKN